jgi:hypothetical protein
MAPTQSYRIHERLGVVLFEGQGALSYERWSAGVDEALADPAFRPGFRFISDRRRMDASRTDRRFADATLFLRSRAAQLGPIRWAVLIGENDPAYTLVRATAVLAQSSVVQLEPFTDLDEALEWILQVVEEEELAELRDWVGAGHSPYT